jgi:tetratricopeptide (TPR) repeat protein
VAQQLEQSRTAFTDLIAKADVGERDLAQAYGSLGKVYHAYEFLDAAELCYLNASRLDPNDFQWPHLLGYLHKQRGRLEESTGFFSRALELRPDDSAAAVHLGEALLQLNRRPEARARFQAALETSADAAALNGLGEEARLEGRFQEAIRYFDAALERVPQATRIHYSLGMAYRGLGRLDEAKSHLQRAGSAGVRPADPIVDSLPGLLQGERVHLIRGQLAYQAKQFEEAANAFRRAIAVAPNSVTGRVNLGSALSELGDTKGALQQLEAALRIDPANVSAHFNLGLLQVRVGDHAGSVEHFHAVIQRAGDDVEAHRQLARSLSMLGREQEAIGPLLKVAALDPDDEDSILDLAVLLTRQKRYEDARAVLDRANRLFPDRSRTAAALARLPGAKPQSAAPRR